jgi:KaiC/GvpD/RAD55 family RecA-like ATPase
MASKLIITSVENLQKEANAIVRTLSANPGIYVSLNKTHESVENILKKEKINISKLFFIDCVTSEQKRDDVLHIRPTDLDKLRSAISTFIEDIPGKKFLLVDALSTLLIYNNENLVAQFVKEVTEFAAEKDVEVIALSPKTKGEELLNKIFNFFDNVKGK